MSRDRVQQVVELGFPVDVKARAEKLRGIYDATRAQRDHPELVDLITWLLSLPGMTHQAIAEAAGISWELVSAVAGLRKTSIREFKLRMAGKLALVLEAAAPGLMEKAAAGKLSALDFKLLTDAWLQLAGEGQLLRVEKEEDPKRAEFRRFMEQAGKGASGAPAGMLQEAEIVSQSGAPISSARGPLAIEDRERLPLPGASAGLDPVPVERLTDCQSDVCDT